MSIKFSSNIGDYIREYSSSMRNIGLVKFHHDITFGQNQISMLMTDPEIYNYFVNNQIPVACTDYSGRYLENGIYIDAVLETKYSESGVLMQSLRKMALREKLNYGNRSLHYLKKEQNCQHLYSMFFDMSQDDFLHFVINNGALIQDLIDDYNFLSNDIIIEATSTENIVTLPNSKDYFAVNDSSRSAATIDNKLCLIHKITGLPIHLPLQRSLCLLHYLSGKTIKSIAKEMQLSPRTVEHYIEILRKELGCRTSKELLLYYSHQIKQ
ncbi:MAG: LuxR C-terminal-related transcriptional regulator [Legionellaceae bacterium]|nr:LuxR C-terminal-related transcriptional regulator [Legionellaceae bacterium]